MKRILLTILIPFFIGIPIWIRAISFKHWQLCVRRIAIATLCLIGIGFCIYLVVNTSEKLSTFTVWFQNIVLVVYLLALVISTYFSWPR